MSQIQVDTITESTSNTGTTVEGVLIKDNKVDGIDVSKTGLVHLNTTTIASGSAVSAFSVESIFSATYTNYKIFSSLYTSNTTDTRCYWRFMSGSSANTDTYSRTQQISRLSSAGDSQDYGQGNYGWLGYLRPQFEVDSSNGGVNFSDIIVFEPRNADGYKGIMFQNLFTRSAASYAGWSYTGYNVLLNNNTAMDGIQFYGASGNIYGTVKVYGIGDG